MDAPITNHGPLVVYEYAFRRLMTESGSLAVHPRGLVGLPDRRIPLNELRLLLARPQVNAPARAAVWCHVVRQARTPGALQSAWTVGVTGLALPQLARMVGALALAYSGGRTVLEAAALGGFVGELRRIDLGDGHNPQLRRQLLMAGYRAARTLRDSTHHPDTRNTHGTHREARERDHVAGEGTPAGVGAHGREGGR